MSMYIFVFDCMQDRKWNFNFTFDVKIDYLAEEELIPSSFTLEVE